MAIKKKSATKMCGQPRWEVCQIKKRTPRIKQCQEGLEGYHRSREENGRGMQTGGSAHSRQDLR